MADASQLARLKKGSKIWNQRRERSPSIDVDLSGADLKGFNLSGVDLRKANLEEANFSDAILSEARINEANLFGAILTKAELQRANLRRANLGKANLNAARLIEVDLVGANLGGADLREAILIKADLTGADLTGARLYGANLKDADLRGARLNWANLNGANVCDADLSRADLSDADLSGAKLIGANLSRADFTGANLAWADLSGVDLARAILSGTKIHKAKISDSSVYAINVWDLRGEFMEQKDLVITREQEPVITVDSIEIAQFLYLILHNKKIRDVISTLSSKFILILGRFSIPERKAILAALKQKLREQGFLPIGFDFDGATDKAFMETIKILADLSCFVIADITNPQSAPLILKTTVPDYQVPFVQIIQEGQQPFEMMADLHRKYNWALEPQSYDSIETVLRVFDSGIIESALNLHHQLVLRKVNGQAHHPLRLKTDIS
jgi:uncharacterized protein YjbI with pentapeptide repeats